MCKLTGAGWKEYAVIKTKPLLAGLLLKYGPDPEPVYASKAQAETPIAILDFLREEIT
jgi:hypothetical protein